MPIVINVVLALVNLYLYFELGYAFNMFVSGLCAGTALTMIINRLMETY